MSDDEQEGGGLRRATVKTRRRSLRVPVDEVPRRSSPGMPRPTFEPKPAEAAPPSMPDLPVEAPALDGLALDPLPPLDPLRTDPGTTSVPELAESDILVDESREMEAVAIPAVAREPLAPPPPPAAAPTSAPGPAIEDDDAPDLVVSSGRDGDGDDDEESLFALGLDAKALDAAAGPDTNELAPEPTVVSAPLRPSIERVEVAPERATAPGSEPAVGGPTPVELVARPSVAEAPRPSHAEVVRNSSVVVARVAVVGTPSAPPPRPSSPPPAVVVAPAPPPAPVSEPELVVQADAPPEESIDLEVDEAPAPPPMLPPAAPPSVVVADAGEEPDVEIGADEIVDEAPAPPMSPSAKAKASQPPPRPIPSGPPPTPEGRAAPPPPPAVSGPPPAPREAPPVPPAPPAAPAVAPPPPAAAPPAPPPAAAPAAPAAPAAADGPPTDPRRSKKKGAWWEDFFNDDYLRTVPAPNPKQVTRQCDFIEQRLGLTQGATVLDVGCGLGLHAIELTRRGFLVVGLDLSLPMLSRAADEAQDHGYKINFLHADMREMNFEGAFDAVLSWGTTFGYFDDDVNKTVLDRMHRALKPGGLLLLDVVNRDYVIRGQPNNVWFEGDGCVVMEETQVNYISSRLHVKRTVMLDDGRQRESAYSVRLYSLHELGQMLHKSFRVVEVSGREATPGVFFGADSPRLLVVAERRLQAVPAAPPAAPPAPPKKSLAGPTAEKAEKAEKADKPEGEPPQGEGG